MFSGCPSSSAARPAPAWCRRTSSAFDTLRVALRQAQGERIDTLRVALRQAQGERIREDEMGEKVVITAAVVGAEVTRAQNPAVPYTPAEIAQAAVDAGKAGAAAVHLHARWPDGRPSQDAAHFREIIDRIRDAGSHVVVQCSTGGAVGMSVEERLGSLVDGAEMGTLNLGTMNFGDDVFLNARPDVVRVAAKLRERGLVPECEVYDAGMLDTLRWLLERGHLAAPYHVQLVLGVPGGMAASERNLRFLVEGLPERTHWSVAGIGRAQLPMAELAVALAARARRDPATPDEARALLGICGVKALPSSVSPA